MIGNSTLLSVVELLPPQTTLSVRYWNYWRVTLTQDGVPVLGGTGANLIEATADLVRWIVSKEKRCPRCGEFDLHNLWSSKAQWKCRICGKRYTSYASAEISDPWKVETLEEAKLFVEQNPKHPVCCAWSDLIYEVMDCGETFCLELFQEELERSARPD